MYTKNCYINVKIIQVLAFRLVGLVVLVPIDAYILKIILIYIKPF